MKNSLMMLAAAVAAAAAGCCSTCETKCEKKCEAKCESKCAPARPLSPSCRTSKMPYKLGVARYTLHKQKLDRALEMLQDMDIHYMGLMEGSIKYDATDAEIAAYKAKLAKFGVEVVSLGPLYYRTEEGLAAAC